MLYLRESEDSGGGDEVFIVVNLSIMYITSEDKRTFITVLEPSSTLQILFLHPGRDSKPFCSFHWADPCPSRCHSLVDCCHPYGSPPVASSSSLVFPSRTKICRSSRRVCRPFQLVLLAISCISVWKCLPSVLFLDARALMAFLISKRYLSIARSIVGAVVGFEGLAAMTACLASSSRLNLRVSVANDCSRVARLMVTAHEQ